MTKLRCAHCTLKVKVHLNWYDPLAWLRLRIRLSQYNIAGLSKVLIVVLHGQICKTLEICPYRQI